MDIILDSSAIINGFDVDYSLDRLITTPAVVKELGKREVMVDFEKIEERKAKQEFVEEVEKEVETTKDALSKQDVALLALALEFKQSEEVSIATDDYGIQNIAKKLGIKFIPVSEAGIKKVFHWQYYCPACKKRYEKFETCDVCGTKLKRKVIR